MKAKTSELSGAQLDWAVAKAKGVEVRLLNGGSEMVIKNGDWWYPSESWEQGGPIIERERIGIKFYGNDLSILPWGAHMLLGWDDTPVEEHGPWPIASDGFGNTPLIAAMRCYVASKLGDEVEIPEELNDPV